MKTTWSNFRILLYLSAILGLCASVFFAIELLYLHPYWTYRAFRVPSASMCPTICAGERIFAQTQPETPYMPQRGDVIGMEFGTARNMFLKRVIGVGGDIVAPGPQNTVLVNGQVWQAPPVCGQPLILPGPSANAGNPPEFSLIQIPKGSYFVIGDNLRNSFDSRYKEFGLVPLSRVRGKAGMIYWSPGKSRVGCIVR
jgi:signal peptidase I